MLGQRSSASMHHEFQLRLVSFGNPFGEVVYQFGVSSTPPTVKFVCIYIYYTIANLFKFSLWVPDFSSFCTVSGYTQCLSVSIDHQDVVPRWGCAMALRNFSRIEEGVADVWVLSSVLFLRFLGACDSGCRFCV